MSWEANGLSYGIPSEIDQWLADGQDVLVNGSRGYLPEARKRYPDLLAVLLTVDQAVLRERLLERRRESLPEIEARLARNAAFTLDAGEDPSLVLLDNSGPIRQTVTQLFALIDRA